MTSPGKGEAEARRLRILQKRLNYLVFGLALTIVLLVLLLQNRTTGLASLGYPGVLLVSFMSSSTVFFPVPGIASVLAGGYFLHPLPVALLAGVGEASGELTGYMMGFGGKGVVERQRFYSKVKGWVHGRSAWAIFLFSIVPNPFFDLVGVAAGALRYHIVRFLLVCWVGKTIKSLLLAYAGLMGLGRLLEFF